MKVSGLVKIFCLAMFGVLAISSLVTAQIQIELPSYNTEADAREAGLNKGMLYHDDYGMVKIVLSSNPEINLITPSSDLQVQKGETVLVEWIDDDPEHNASIFLYYDPDINETPWIGTENHTLLSTFLEDPDGSGDQYLWDTTNVELGTYTVWARIDNGEEGQNALAEGLVTVIDNSSCDWNLFCEEFDNLDNWTTCDHGTSYSEIVQPGQLHQISYGQSGYTMIYGDIGETGSGDYTLEFRIMFATLSGTDFVEIQVQGSSHTLHLHFDPGILKVYNGLTYNTITNKTWSLNTWYTVTLIVHNDQMSVDTYLDGILQTSNVDCGWEWSSQDGYVRITNNPNLNVDVESYVDYFKIATGQKQP